MGENREMTKASPMASICLDILKAPFLNLGGYKPSDFPMHTLAMLILQDYHAQ